jgi:hypothetical protein
VKRGETLDKWVVKNTSGTVLLLPKNKVNFTIGGRIDLVERLGKSVREIELDSEISRALAYNNISTVEKYDSSKDHERELSGKLDQLMSFLKSKEPATEVSKSGIEIDSKEIATILDKYFKDRKTKGSDGETDGEEDKMREDAIRKMIESSKHPDGTLDGFGVERKSEDTDDFSDFVDF